MEMQAASMALTRLRIPLDVQLVLFQPTQAASNGELAGASENVGITTAGSGNSNSASGTNGGSASGGSPTPSMQAGGQTASSETSADSQNQNSTASPLSYNSQLNRQPETTRPVARARGRNWAWSQGPPTETPVVRSIRVQCLNDRWLVVPDSGSSKTSLTVSFESTPRERAEQLAKIVLERVDSWGIALTGGHWKPVLLVEVAPDAEWRFEQLKQLLDGSGLEIQRRTAE